MDENGVEIDGLPINGMGKRLQFANLKNLENGPVEIVDLPINSMVIFHSFLYVYQAGYPRGIPRWTSGILIWWGQSWDEDISYITHRIHVWYTC